MKYHVTGADTSTGKDRLLVIEAADEEIAASEARSQGVYPYRVQSVIEETSSDHPQTRLRFDVLPIKCLITLLAFFVLFWIVSSLSVYLAIFLTVVVILIVVLVYAKVFEKQSLEKKYREYQRTTDYERKTALGEQIINLIDSKSDDDWRKVFCAHYLQWRRRIVAELTAPQPKVESPTVRQLAELRADGLLSNEEFKAFCDRFGKSTGEKAREIVGAIESLHKQFRSGAMSEGNYHSGLWSLLDKLDRNVK